jgi:flagella basal body P-ring formation protein FlgA
MIPIVMFVAATTACHAVNGDRITAGDLAAVFPAFATVAPEKVIGYAPEPGDHRLLEPAELLRIAAANGVELRNTTSTCFERALMPLEAPAILNALRTSLNRPGAEIEVIEFSKFFVPPGKIVFPLESMPARAMDHVAIWNGYVDVNGRRFPIWARARITVPQTRVVAIVQIHAGQTIGAGDVREEEARDYPTKIEPLKSAADCVHQLARRFMNPGTPITAGDLLEPNDVDRGDTVSVEVHSGGAVLMLPAQADMAGRAGQVISFRNASSGKTFRAQITGKDRALLDFRSPETSK